MDHMFFPPAFLSHGDFVYCGFQVSVFSSVMWGQIFPSYWLIRGIKRWTNVKTLTSVLNQWYQWLVNVSSLQRHGHHVQRSLKDREVSSTSQRNPAPTTIPSKKHGFPLQICGHLIGCSDVLIKARSVLPCKTQQYKQGTYRNLSDYFYDLLDIVLEDSKIKFQVAKCVQL